MCKVQLGSRATPATGGVRSGLRNANVTRERVTHCSGVNNLHSNSRLSNREPGYRVNSTYCCTATGHYKCCWYRNQPSEHACEIIGTGTDNFVFAAISYHLKIAFTECLRQRKRGDGVKNMCLAVKQLV